MRPAEDARACRTFPSPCERIDEKQRAGLDALTSIRHDALGSTLWEAPGSNVHEFRRCTLTENGAVGLVPSRSDENAVFRVVFESKDGASVASDEHALLESPPEEVLVFPPPRANAAPVTFVKFATRLEPAPLGRPVPAQTVEFFSPISRTGRSPAQRVAPKSYVWTDLQRIEGHYRIQFRLPDFRWKQQVAYGGEVERTLDGVEAFVFLDARYELASNEDLRGAVTYACTSVPTLDRAAPARLWAAAQCQRVRGEALATVLERVTRRCDALARQALPISRSLATLHGRERDGHPTARWEIDETVEKLRRVDPPSACFSQDHLWNIDYTARMRPIEVPKVVLDGAWREGLEDLGEWP